jgi:hypothetical protein
LILGKGRNSSSCKAPFDLVGKQQDAFEKFVRSIRFGRGEGAKP